jgi:hypothetical protein
MEPVGMENACRERNGSTERTANMTHGMGWPFLPRSRAAVLPEKKKSRASKMEKTPVLTEVAAPPAAPLGKNYEWHDCD